MKVRALRKVRQEMLGYAYARSFKKSALFFGLRKPSLVSIRSLRFYLDAFKVPA